MAVLFQNATIGDSGASNVTTINTSLPTGLVAGSKMLLYLFASQTTAGSCQFDSIAGWTPLNTPSSSGIGTNFAFGTGQYAILYRDWQSGDSAPTFTTSGAGASTKLSWSISNYTGAIAGVPSAFNQNATGSTTTSTSATLTPAQNNSLIFYVAVAKGTVTMTTCTSPAIGGLARRASIFTMPSITTAIVVEDYTQTTAAATGAQVWTWSGTANSTHSVVTVVLAPITAAATSAKTAATSVTAARSDDGTVTQAETAGSSVTANTSSPAAAAPVVTVAGSGTAARADAAAVSKAVTAGSSVTASRADVVSATAAATAAAAGTAARSDAGTAVVAVTASASVTADAGVQPTPPPSGDGPMFRPAPVRAPKQVRRRLRVYHGSLVVVAGRKVLRPHPAPVRLSVSVRAAVARRTRTELSVVTRSDPAVGMCTAHRRITCHTVDHRSVHVIDAFHRERTPRQLRDELAIIAAVLHLREP